MMPKAVLSRLALFCMCVTVIVSTPVSQVMGKAAPIVAQTCKERISNVSIVFSGVRKSLEIAPVNKTVPVHKGTAVYKVVTAYKGAPPDEIKVDYNYSQTSTNNGTPIIEGMVWINTYDGINEYRSPAKDCENEIIAMMQLHDSLDSKISASPDERTAYLDKISLYESYRDYANAALIYDRILRSFPDLKSDNEFLKLFHRTQAAEVCETRIRRMTNNSYGTMDKAALEAYRFACVEENATK